MWYNTNIHQTEERILFGFPVRLIRPQHAESLLSSKSPVSKSLCPSHCVQVTVSKSLCPSHCVQVTVFKSLCSSHCVQVTVFKSPVFKSLCSSHRVQVTRTASTTRASTRNARTNWILTSTGSQEKSEGDKDDRQLHIKASIRARFTSHTTICFTDRVTK